MTNDEKIKKAAALIANAEKLQEQADDLLEGIAKEAAATNDAAHILSVAMSFPRGFYRSELLVLVNTLAPKSPKGE